MQDPRDQKEPNIVPTPAPPRPAKKIGFGAFSETYRARWAANHPKMERGVPGEAAGSPDSTVVDINRYRAESTDLPGTEPV